MIILLCHLSINYSHYIKDRTKLQKIMPFLPTFLIFLILINFPILFQKIITFSEFSLPVYFYDSLSLK